MERALDNPTLRRRLATVLIGEPPAAPSEPAAASAHRSDRQHQPEEPGTSALQLDLTVELDALVAIIRDDLHVQRLRQIWDVISDRLEQRPVVVVDLPATRVGSLAAAE